MSNLATSGRSPNMRAELSFRQCGLNDHSGFQRGVPWLMYVLFIEEYNSITQSYLFSGHRAEQESTVCVGDDIGEHRVTTHKA